MTDPWCPCIPCIVFGPHQGMHMDVVPANPAEWTHDPFTFLVDGDDLYGRGTTDCLGHVALVTVRWARAHDNAVVTHDDASNHHTS
jgi:acetylornithine deacetylase/succinyl-diaminopimelate desuccinylase-like protein